MNDCWHIDGRRASKIVKKHIDALKDEFKQNGWELTDVKNYSFGWRYINQNQSEKLDAKLI